MADRQNPLIFQPDFLKSLYKLIPEFQSFGAFENSRIRILAHTIKNSGTENPKDQKSESKG